VAVVVVAHSTPMHSVRVRRDVDTRHSATSKRTDTRCWWWATVPRVCCDRRRAHLARAQGSGAHPIQHDADAAAAAAVVVLPNQHCHDAGADNGHRSCLSSCRGCVAGGRWCTEPDPDASELFVELKHVLAGNREQTDPVGASSNVEKTLDALDLYDRFTLRASALVAEDAAFRLDFATATRMYTAAQRAINSLDRRAQLRGPILGRDASATLDVSVDSVSYGSAVPLAGSERWAAHDLVIPLVVAVPPFYHGVAGSVALIHTHVRPAHCVPAFEAEVAQVAAVGAAAVLVVGGGECADTLLNISVTAAHPFHFDLPVAVFRAGIGVHITTSLLQRPGGAATAVFTRLSTTGPEIIETENTRLAVHRGLHDSRRALVVAAGKEKPDVVRTTSENDACAAVASSLPVLMPGMLSKTEAARLWSSPSELVSAHGEVAVVTTRATSLLDRHVVQGARMGEAMLEPTPWVVELNDVPMGELFLALARGMCCCNRPLCCLSLLSPADRLLSYLLAVCAKCTLSDMLACKFCGGISVMRSA
jgi:hypothetical protein